MPDLSPVFLPSILSTRQQSETRDSSFYALRDTLTHFLSIAMGIVIDSLSVRSFLDMTSWITSAIQTVRDKVRRTARPSD